MHRHKLAVVEGTIAWTFIAQTLLAAWATVGAPLRTLTPSARLTALGRLASRWVATRGYLPWHAILAVLAHPHLTEVWVGSIAATALLLWAQTPHGGGREGPAEDAYGGPAAVGAGQHGTARWRTVAEVAATFPSWRRGSPGAGVFVGAKEVGKAAYVHAGEEHVLLLGSTGSGKSRRVILPTIGALGSARAS